MDLNFNSLFEQKLSDKVIQALNSNPSSMLEAFEAIQEILNSSNTQAISNTLEVVKNMVATFGIPIVLQLNDLNIIISLGAYSQVNKQQVNSLLEECLLTFGFDKEKKIIDVIAGLWLQLNSQCTSYPTREEKPRRFTVLYEKINNLISKSTSDLNNREKSDLYSKLNSVLKNEDFENNEFNALEKGLANYLYDNLVSILENLKPTPGMNNEIKKALKPINENDKLSHRTCFTLGERVKQDEDITTEYKEYGYPLNEISEKVLKKVICAFLNRRGGRIYIGISDDKIVKGIALTHKQRDLTRLQIQNLLSEFEPSVINEELIKVIEIPIIDPNTSEIIPGRFVLKVIIKQGNPKRLYSVCQIPFESYIRNEGQSKALTAKLIAEYILERHENPSSRIPDEEFNDPKPEEIKDVYEAKGGPESKTIKMIYDEASRPNFPKKLVLPGSKKENQSQVENSNQHTNIHDPSNHNFPSNQHQDHQLQGFGKSPGTKPGQEIIVVFLEGLPSTMIQKRFDAFIAQMNLYSLVSSRLFKLKDGSCNGKAFLNFLELKEAQQVVKRLNDQIFDNSKLKAKITNAPKVKTSFDK